MPRGRKRTGNLTDADTLRLYERGTSPHDIAALEGVSASTILKRISDARRERGKAVQRHRNQAQSVVDRNARQRAVRPPVSAEGDPYGLRTLNAAVDRLAGLEHKRG